MIFGLGMRTVHHRILKYIELAKQGKLSSSDRQRLIRIFNELKAAQEALLGNVDVPEESKEQPDEKAA